MRDVRQRVAVACLASAFGALLGAGIGLLIGRTILLNQAQLRLEQFTSRVLSDGDKSTAESRKVLSAMNGSSFSFCSDAELSYFRQLVYQSLDLKDAGRIRDGKIACSTTFGRDTTALMPLRPEFAQKDGTLLYRDPPMFSVVDKTVIAVQLGSAYIVYRPRNFASFAAAGMHYTVTDTDAATLAAGRLTGETPMSPGLNLTRENEARLGGNIYLTRCSVGGAVCMTAFMSEADAIRSGRLALPVFVLMGALVGTLLGFVVSLVYRRKNALQQQLLRAIRRDDLRVVYQPIVDLASGKIVEAEALVRWTDEDNQPVSPEVFVKVAEERGFVGEITRLVVRRVLRELGKTLRERPGFRINVNIAAPDLADSTFLPMLENALQRAAVRPESLAIEITESYTARQQVAKETILQLRRNGHYVYIDDFGTGYSSLAYLHDLSVDAIKIDKAFTRAIGTDAVTVSILPQILTMAQTLNLRVIVEGIETPQQAHYFADVNQSIYAQGWLFGHPVPVEDFLQLLQAADSGKQQAIPAEEQRAMASALPAV